MADAKRIPIAVLGAPADRPSAMSQVDVEAGTLAVTETIVRGRRGSVGVGEPKSEAGRRTLALPAPLAEMLAKHMAARG